MSVITGEWTPNYDWTETSETVYDSAGTFLSATPNGHAVRVDEGRYFDRRVTDGPSTSTQSDTVEVSANGAAGLRYAYGGTHTYTSANIDITQSASALLAAWVYPATSSRHAVVESIDASSRAVASLNGNLSAYAVDNGAATSWPLPFFIVPTAKTPWREPGAWPAIPDTVFPDIPSDADILEGHNAERRAVGLVELTLNDQLREAAGLHAAWMEETGTAGHIGLNGSTPQERMVTAGYGTSAAADDGGVPIVEDGENIAYGGPGVAPTIAAWMASPTARDVILKPEFRELGVFVLPSAHWGFLWVVNFGDVRELK